MFYVIRNQLFQRNLPKEKSYAAEIFLHNDHELLQHFNFL